MKQRDWPALVLLLGIAVMFGLTLSRPQTKQTPSATPDRCDPLPTKQPTPKRPWESVLRDPCDRSDLPVVPPTTTFHAGGPEFRGEAITCDLPIQEHLRNAVGRDGLGLCVFTSLDHAARWANEPVLIGFRDYMKSHPGGGWPDKLEQFIARIAEDRKLPVPGYVQHTGGDPEFLRLAMKTGRYVSVTYHGRDGVFYRGAINHMVNLVHFSDHWAAIHDNNFPGQWLWMPPTEFLSRWKTSGGWAVVLLKPGPPPIPVNGARANHSGIWATALEVIPEETESPIPNYGLDASRIPETPQYRLNGKEVSRWEAFSAFGGLTDDSNKLRLTIVGDDAFRRRVIEELAQDAQWATWRDRLLVQDYSRDHWAVTGVGIAPGITLQSPPGSDGKAAVLLRVPQYTGAGSLFAAIRKADPNYRPERDPNGVEKETAWSIDWSKIPPGLWVLLGLTLVLIFVKRKEPR